MKAVILISVLFFISCWPQDPMFKRIKELSTLLDHREFLDDLKARDQDIRSPENDFRLSHGVRSSEYLNSIKEMQRVDSLNLLYVKAYLKQHGHPNYKEVGLERAVVPFLVLQHVSDIDVRNAYTPMLIDVYKNGGLRSSWITGYLTRSFELTFGYRHKMERPYTAEMEIDTLVHKLGLNNNKE